MRILPFIIALMLSASTVFSQSPHGDELKLDCSYCHEPTSWKVIPEHIKFNHDETSFKLTGQHAEVGCKSCHTSLIFSDAKSNCNSCHRDVHQSTLGPDCSRCHTPTTWLISNANEIHRNTRFPLVGAHQNVDCASCHSGYSELYFPPLNTSCISCHAEQYYAATSPNHVQSGFSIECQDCHGVTGFVWTAANFNHDFFPLVGGHNIQNCFACHTQGSNFNGLSTDCYSCHKTNYEQTISPNHAALGMSTDCKSCHTINAWIPASFNHATTGFALTGSHSTLNCSACHKGTIGVLSPDCISCHRDKYNSAPNHAAQNYPTDCKMCHNTTSWNQSTFDHNTTAFPLTGAHTTVNCSSCHTTGFAGIPTICYSCHQQNYQSTTNPNHPALALPTGCETCHTTNPGWKPATFPIHNNYYQIVGAHASLTCDQCHNGNYNTAPATCYGCHQNDYNSTTNPAHQAAGFPTDCQSCHSQSAWQPSTFNHDGQYFPIYSGTHAGRWTLCSDCHTNSTNFTVFSCINCHEHSQANTDPHHQDVGGYVYSPTSCYSCHPSGTAGD